MNRSVYSIIIVVVFIVICAAHWIHYSEQQSSFSPNTQVIASRVEKSPTTEVSYKKPPPSYALSQSRFVSQSFNNCGPASLSMVMSMFGKDVDQEVLADRMRPFHNPEGGVDDKSIFAHEFVTYAEDYGFKSLERPNGDIELLKTLIANDIPVIVRTWLHQNEDIGHFRIVRGYNENDKTILQDDSYQGPNLTYSYEEFLSMWQPFNYGYILVYPPEKQALVEEILGGSKNEQTAYKNSIDRANKELQACHPGGSETTDRISSGDSIATLQDDNRCAYSYFNLASASYYLNDYKKAVENYEKAASELPSRMLWYQIEPILAYQKIGADDTVFFLTDRILNNGNKAYSELYQIRGEVYEKQGNIEAARAEYDKAALYNSSFKPAKAALTRLRS